MQNIAKQRKAEKMKEDLRKLVGIEGNKHCAVCATRGPMYAVLDFNIFVCSTCSAIHRSMQHKVKGITMSEFTDEEYAALRVGGNSRATSIWKVGYHLSPPPAGDDYRVRECIRACFEDRRFFDRAAFSALQEDIATAILPPVKILTSLDAPVTPAPTVRPAQAPAATQATAQHSVVQTAPKQPTQAPVAAQPKDTNVLEGTDMFASPAAVAPRQAPAPTPQPTDAFDDFFAARTAPTAPPPARSNPTDDMFGPMATAHKPQPQAQPSQSSLDFFSAPVSSAPPQHAQRSTADFFSAPVSAPQPSSMDFFSSAQAAPQHTTQHSTQHTGDFFAVPSAAKADVFAPTVWQSRPVDANLKQYQLQQQQEQSNLWGSPQSAPAPTSSTSSAMTNAFADLDPFGGRPRNN